MKAIIWTKYGPPDVLEVREVEKPDPSCQAPYEQEGHIALPDYHMWEMLSPLVQ